VDPTFGDEALLLYGAKRVLSGQMIYRDFWSITFPGSYYILALFFKIFGTKIVIARIITDLIVASSGVLLFIISKKLTREILISLIPSCFVIFTFSFHYITSYYWYELIFSLVVVYFIIRYIEDSKKYNIILAGIFLVLETLCLHYKGAMNFVSVYLFLGLSPSIFDFSQRSNNKYARLYLLFIFSIVMLTLTVFLIYKAPVFFDTILFPFVHFMTKLTSPHYYHFGNLVILENINIIKLLIKNILSEKIFSQFLLIIVAINRVILHVIWGYVYFFVILVGIGIIYNRKKNDFNYQVFFFLLIFVTLSLIPNIMRRADKYVLSFNTPIAMIIFSACLLYLKKWKRNLISIYVLFATLSYILIMTVSVIHSFKYPVEWTGWGKVYYTNKNVADDYNSIITFVNKNLPYDGHILAYIYGPNFYLMLGRDNPTHFDIPLMGLGSEYQKNDFLFSIYEKMPEYIIHDQFIKKLNRINPYAGEKIPPFPPFEEFLKKYYYPLLYFDKVDVIIYKRRDIQSQNKF
jgi:hypothetical protein